MKKVLAGLIGAILLFAAGGCNGTVTTVNIGSRWGYQNISEESVYAVTAVKPEKESWNLNYYPTGSGTLTMSIEGLTLEQAKAECPDPSLFEGVTATSILKVRQDTDFNGQFRKSSDDSALGDPFTYDISVTSYCLTSAKTFQTLYSERQMRVAYVTSDWETQPYAYTVKTSYQNNQVHCKIDILEDPGESFTVFPVLEGEGEANYNNSFFFDNDSIYYAIRSIQELSESYRLTYQTFDYNTMTVKSVNLSMASTSSDSSATYVHEVNISGMICNDVTVPQNTSTRCLKAEIMLSGTNSGTPLSLYYCIGGEDDPYETVHFAGADSSTSYRKLVRMEQGNFTYVMTSFQNRSAKA